MSISSFGTISIIAGAGMLLVGSFILIGKFVNSREFDRACEDISHEIDRIRTRAKLCTKKVATEIMLIGRARRQYLQHNDQIHLFVDRPVRHYCDRIWRYSSSQQYPQLLVGCNPPPSNMYSKIFRGRPGSRILFAADNYNSNWRPAYIRSVLLTINCYQPYRTTMYGAPNNFRECHYHDGFPRQKIFHTMTIRGVPSLRAQFICRHMGRDRISIIENFRE